MNTLPCYVEGLPCFVEGLKPVYVRCHQCRNPVAIEEHASFSRIECSECGSSFGLVDETVDYEAPEHQRVAHFELIEELGSGAFGSVFKARDAELDRIVAIKMPRSGQLDASETERFLREARAAAQLNHHNIVSVHEVGRENNNVYIVSDFIDGMTLADWLTGQLPSCKEAAKLCLTVAEAVNHAHEKGVIHRDLKPGNILLDADGVPHVADFGLARREAGDVTMTIDGKIMGTPAYMSPEQARGEAHQADRRSDIYSLGVILFEVLTGEKPFRGNTRMMLHQVLNDEPPSPRSLNSQIPLDLETICLKCLEKEPSKRYATARALAEDLDSYLCGEPIRARPVSSWEKTYKWVRRRPAVAGFVAASFVAIVASVALAVGIPLFLRWQSEAREARTAEHDAVVQKKRANKYLYVFEVFRADLYWREGNRGGAIETLTNADPNYRDWEWYYLYRRFHQERDGAPAVRTVGAHEGLVSGAGFAGLAGDKIVSGGSDGEIRIWDANRQGESRSLGQFDRPVLCMVVSMNGALVAAASDADEQGVEGSEVRVWEIETGQEVLKSRVSGNVASLAFSPNGTRLAAAIANQTGGGVMIWSFESEHERRFIPQPTSVRCVAFGPKGERIAAVTGGQGDETDSIVVWNTNGSHDKTLKLNELPSKVGAFTFSPSGRHLLVGGDSNITIWDADKGRFLMEFHGHTKPIRDFAFSRSGARLASVADDGTIKLWDWQRHQAVSPNRPVFGPGDSATGLGRQWRGIFNEAILTVLPDDSTVAVAITSVAFRPDGGTIVSGSSDGVLRLWDGTPQFGVSVHAHRGFQN